MNNSDAYLPIIFRRIERIAPAAETIKKKLELSLSLNTWSKLLIPGSESSAEMFIPPIAFAAKKRTIIRINTKIPRPVSILITRSN